MHYGIRMAVLSVLISTIKGRTMRQDDLNNNQLAHSVSLLQVREVQRNTEKYSS